MKKIISYLIFLLTTTQSFCQFGDIIEITHEIHNGNVTSQLKDTTNPHSDILQEIGMCVLGEKGFEEYKMSLDDSSYTKRKNKLNLFINKKSKNGIVLFGWNLHPLNWSWEEVGSRINFFIYNPTNKIIQSITFQVKGSPDMMGDGISVLEYYRYNGNVVNNVGFKPIIKLKGTGKIKPKSAVVHDFAFTWHPYGVRNVSIMSVKIKYTDNSTIFIKNPNDVMITKNLYQSIFN